MDDLIRRKDVERALTVLGVLLSESQTRTVEKCIYVIKNIRAVDAEPVRHGRWEHGMQCPFCKQIDTAKPNYCCNCGAKMDGGD